MPSVIKPQQRVILSRSVIKKLLKWLLIISFQILIISIILQIYQITTNKDADGKQEINGDLDKIWANAPRFSLILRMYHGSVSEYWQMFAPSYLIFWPRKKWLSSDLILIFDDDSLKDHQAATTLSILPPYPKILYENPPPPGTTCSQWRTEGYSRQMFSCFMADQATDAPFIGFADADAVFITKVVPEDLFVNGKPRILGYNINFTLFVDSALSVVPGKTAVAEFMIIPAFPFIVRREHFAQFRQHVTAVYGKATFEEAFHEICSTFETYAQYDLLAFYLFHYHRDDYSWHIRDNAKAEHPDFPGGAAARMTSDPEVLAFSEPAKIFVSKHGGNMGHSENFPFQQFLYDYICFQTDFSLGSCSNEPYYFQEGIRKSVEQNLITDNLVETAFWNERLMPANLSVINHREGREKFPFNSEQLFRERNDVLQGYNGSWNW